MIQRSAQIAELTRQDENTLSFKDAVAFNVENGLIVGSNGEIKPRDTIYKSRKHGSHIKITSKSRIN